MGYNMADINMLVQNTLMLEYEQGILNKVLITPQDTIRRMKERAEQSRLARLARPLTNPIDTAAGAIGTVQQQAKKL